MASDSSSGSAPPKKPKKSAAAGNPDNSFYNSDNDPSDYEGEVSKKQLTSNYLLHKYVKAMISDHKRRDKAYAPKLQPYKVDP